MTPVRIDRRTFLAGCALAAAAAGGAG
ncbi:twin-arginine translocation signal domain-containing protein, partial [Sutterella parvirubra]